MDIKDLEHEIELLKQKIAFYDEAREGQAKRIESHFDSERRHRTGIIKTADKLEADMKDNKEKIKEYHDILYNKGSGLMFRVRDIETKVAHSDSMMQKVALVISVIISALALYFSMK